MHSDQKLLTVYKLGELYRCIGQKQLYWQSEELAGFKLYSNIFHIPWPPPSTSAPVDPNT